MRKLKAWFLFSIIIIFLLLNIIIVTMMINWIGRWPGFSIIIVIIIIFNIIIIIIIVTMMIRWIGRGFSIFARALEWSLGSKERISQWADTEVIIRIITIIIRILMMIIINIVMAVFVNISMGRYKGDQPWWSLVIKVMIINSLRSINKACKNDIEGEREQALVDQWVGFLLASLKWSVGEFFYHVMIIIMKILIVISVLTFSSSPLVWTSSLFPSTHSTLKQCMVVKPAKQLFFSFNEYCKILIQTQSSAWTALLVTNPDTKVSDLI